MRAYMRGKMVVIITARHSGTQLAMHVTDTAPHSLRHLLLSFSFSATPALMSSSTYPSNHCAARVMQGAARTGRAGGGGRGGGGNLIVDSDVGVRAHVLIQQDFKDAVEGQLLLCMPCGLKSSRQLGAIPRRSMETAVPLPQYQLQGYEGADLRRVIPLKLHNQRLF